MIQTIGIGVRPEYSSAALVLPASQPLAREQADWRVALCAWGIRTLPCPVGDHRKAILTFVMKEGERAMRYPMLATWRARRGCARLCFKGRGGGL